MTFCIKESQRESTCWSTHHINTQPRNYRGYLLHFSPGKKSFAKMIFWRLLMTKSSKTTWAVLCSYVWNVFRVCRVNCLMPILENYLYLFSLGKGYFHKSLPTGFLEWPTHLCNVFQSCNTLSKDHFNRISYLNKLELHESHIFGLAETNLNWSHFPTKVSFYSSLKACWP